MSKKAGAQRVSDKAGAVMITYVAGFNAHGQLCDSHTKDIKLFERGIEVSATTSGNGELFFAGWSSTLFRGAGKEGYAGDLVSLGHFKIAENACESHEHLRCAVGDHNGFMACLDDEGRLYVAERDRSTDLMLLRCQSTEAAPMLSHLALAQNGRVAITFKQAPNGNLCHIAEFATFEAFCKWYQHPSDEDNYPEHHYMLPGRPRQLLGSIATFILLMERGEVYTWGDARHQSLGRAVAAEDSVPANRPGVVEALGGLKISKIASGGWISAALSEDAALYIWGSTPNTESRISALHDGGADDANLVQLPDTKSEPLDVIDVAVGDSHLAVITEGSRLFVVGNNEHGQLGLGSDQAQFQDWQEVGIPDMMQPGNIEGIAAGPKCTFAYVTSEMRSCDRAFNLGLSESQT